MSMITGLTSKLQLPIPIYDVGQPPRTSVRHCSLKNTLLPIKRIPLGKMSWMNIVLILHSLLFFFSSSITSLVYLTTSNIILAYWISVIILANCSLNFYVYCLSGGQFRTELKRIARRYIRYLYKKILCHKCRHHPSSLLHGKDLLSPSFPQQQEFQVVNSRQDRMIKNNE
jgi:hypothetical protein